MQQSGYLPRGRAQRSTSAKRIRIWIFQFGRKVPIRLTFDPTADSVPSGRRTVAASSSSRPAQDPRTCSRGVLNWAEELKSRVPPGP